MPSTNIIKGNDISVHVRIYVELQTYSKLGKKSLSITFLV